MESPLAGPEPRIPLTEARVRRSWSQQEVANHLGTTHVNVSRWERGLTKPNPYYRRKLCMLFGLTEEELGISARVGVALSGEKSQPLSPIPPPSPVIGQSENGSVEAAPPPPLSNPHPAPTPIVPDVIYDPAIPLEPAIPLVGRADLLAKLRQRLRTGGSVALTALNGLPGVGKTALSVTLAHDPELRTHFHDGVLWAGLGPEPNIPGLLSRWGTMLGISASEMTNLDSNEARARAIRSTIGTRALLLVIDDAWTIEGALIFKVGGPNCAHLVTTRFGAIAVQMAGDGATNISELTNEQSLQLLSILAPNAVESEQPKVQDLVLAVGGLPLALTLMGNYLRKQSYSGQARRIRAALQKLSDAAERLQVSEPRGPSETHPSLPLEQQQISLQTVIAVTDQQLSAQARKAFYALAVFPPKPNSFSEEAALAVASCDFDTIDLLADTGLLESSGEGRYTLHQTIADYVRVHLKEQEPYERLVQYAIGYVEEHKKDYSYELLDRESSTILAALDAAYTLREHDELVRLVDAYVPTLLRLGFYTLATQHIQRVKEISVIQNNPKGIACASLYSGQIAQTHGDLAQADILFKEGLEVARHLNNKKLMSTFLTELGSVSWKRAEHTNAEMYLQEGLNIARELDDIEHICTLLNTLGSQVARKGDYNQSEVYLQEALPLTKQLGDRERTCRVLMNLGATVGQQGKYAQAETFFHDALLLARQIGHREWITGLLSNLGDLANAQGNYSQAEAYMQDGLILARDIEQREWISVLLINLGLTTREQKRYREAEKYLKEALVLARQLGIPQITATALYEHGTLQLLQNYFYDAKQCFEEILTSLPEGGQDLIALAQYGLAKVAFSEGDFQEAQKLGENSLVTLEKLNNRSAKEVENWLKTVTQTNQF